MRRDDFRALMEEQPNLTPKEAAKELKTSVEAVYLYAKGIGITFKHSKFGYLKTAQLLGRRAQGVELKQLSSDFGLLPNTIAMKCRKYRASDCAAYVRRQKAIDSVITAVLESDDWKSFKAQQHVYRKAKRLGILEEIKAKFD